MFVEEFQKNPLSLRLISIFDKEKSDQIDFSTFLNTLNILTQKTDLKKKMECISSILIYSHF
jgi:Ca2+-binding EF-hand superfamily protein